MMLADPELIERDFDDFVYQAASSLERDLEKSDASYVFAKWFYTGTMEADIRKLARAVASGSTDPDLLYMVFIVGLDRIGSESEDAFLRSAEDYSR